jgi:hypothetical protein
MRREIVMLGGLAADILEESSMELAVVLELWQNDYKGPNLVDASMGFSKMLNEWPMPWPYNSMSSLNGLTLAQFYMLEAAREIELSLAILAPHKVKEGAQCIGFDCDDAACFAIYATKALTRAKHLLASNENVLGQADH